VSSALYRRGVTLRDLRTLVQVCGGRACDRMHDSCALRHQEQRASSASDAAYDASPKRANSAHNGAHDNDDDNDVGDDRVVRTASSPSTPTHSQKG
jgi:hypothetical protein